MFFLIRHSETRRVSNASVEKIGQSRIWHCWKSIFCMSWEGKTSLPVRDLSSVQNLRSSYQCKTVWIFPLSFLLRPLIIPLQLVTWQARRVTTWLYLLTSFAVLREPTSSVWACTTVPKHFSFSPAACPNWSPRQVIHVIIFCCPASTEKTYLNAWHMRLLVNLLYKCLREIRRWSSRWFQLHYLMHSHLSSTVAFLRNW